MSAPIELNLDELALVQSGLRSRRKEIEATRRIFRTPSARAFLDLELEECQSLLDRLGQIQVGRVGEVPW